jgi:hypothetical protein
MRRVCVSVVACTALMVLAATAGGAVAPGSPRAVAALVSASTRIERVSRTVQAALATAAHDDASTHYPSTDPNCTGPRRCVFGDARSAHIDVLFGDSHARMWLTAMLPVLRASHVRLVLLWLGSCPAAELSVWKGGRRCDAWRTAALATIAGLRPHTVFIGDDTTASAPSGPDTAISMAVWQRGEERTIRALQRDGRTRVVVFGDVTQFVVPVPECLAAYPTDVQRCSVPYPNPAVPHHQGAERAAARATGAVYVDPAPWLCARRCSPIVGQMIVYSDVSHVTYTYERFLSTVVGDRLRALL